MLQLIPAGKIGPGKLTLPLHHHIIKFVFEYAPMSYFYNTAIEGDIMFYRYETHLHTSETSKCGTSTAVEMVRAHKAAGYTGIIVTDHFVNANCTVPKHLPWDKQMELFTRGYEHAKAEGDQIGLDVFFGWEYPNNPYGEDYLTYNLDPQFLPDHPDLTELPFEEYCRLVHENGGLIIQAHPYRTAFYILYDPDPKVHLIDGVEVNNGESDADYNHNHKAWELARANPRLIRTSGTDIHKTERAGIAGVAFRYRIESSQHFVDAMKSGDAYLIIDGKITDREGNRVE
jgi:hypothetical protein